MKTLTLEEYQKLAGEPESLGMWDLRPLHDFPIPAEIRTKYLPPVLTAYQGSLTWPQDKQLAVASKLIIRTVNRILSKLPYLSEKVRNDCLNAATPKDAESARLAAWTMLISEARPGEKAALLATGIMKLTFGGNGTEPREAARSAAWAAEWAAQAEASEQPSEQPEIMKKFFIIACNAYIEASKIP